jgi:hypothetical protein
MKHSGYGLASFVLFMAGLGIFLGWAIVNGAAASNYSANQSVPAFLLVLVEGLFLLWTEPFLIVSFLGVCLAVAGLFQHGRGKRFAVLGLLLNGFALAMSIGLMVFSWSVIK